MRYDVAVIGGGPAGMAAAVAAQKAGARTLIIERDHRLGGILQQCIHNGFGLHYFSEELTGPEYAARFIEQVQNLGIDVMTETFVLGVDREKKLHCVGPAQGMFEVEAGAIVLAMGCRERTRGALAIPGTRPAGVMSAGCAQRLCNLEGYMPGKRVVVLGSGDIGLIMARRMAWEGAQVLMVCEIMPHSSGLNRNIVQCLEDNDIPLHFNTTVTRIHGAQRLEAVTIAQVDANRKPILSTERTIACDTLLLSVGLIPENELTKAVGIPLDAATGGAIVDDRRMTRVPGFFACGNVLHVHDLVDNVSDEAALTGAAAADYALNADAPQQEAMLKTCAGQGVLQVVPQYVGEKKTTLYFRVRSVVNSARITVKCGDEVLASRSKLIVTPGEMERIEIDPAGCQGEIVVEVS